MQSTSEWPAEFKTLPWWTRVTNNMRGVRMAIFGWLFRVGRDQVVSDLRSTIETKDYQIRALQVDLESARSENRILQEEVKNLGLVLSRDRKRIESEMASYAHQIASATVTPVRREQ